MGSEVEVKLSEHMGRYRRLEEEKQEVVSQLNQLNTQLVESDTVKYVSVSNRFFCPLSELIQFYCLSSVETNPVALFVFCWISCIASANHFIMLGIGPCERWSSCLSFSWSTFH